MADRDAKAKTTDTVAKQIIDADRAEIAKKSERLRQLRLAMEAQQPAPVPKPKATRAKRVAAK